MLKIKNLSNTTKGARSLVHIYILYFSFFFSFFLLTVYYTLTVALMDIYLGVFGENFEETRN